MNVSRQMNCRRRTSGILCALLIAGMPAASAFSLPIGYPQDFNGCSDVKDKAEREACCDSVERDCKKACGDLIEGGKLAPGASISCDWDCEDANVACKNGDKVKARIPWPGETGLRIPGIFADDNRIRTDEGIGLSISTRTTVIEIRRDGAKRETSACAAVVATCKCPPSELAYETLGKECRPVVTSGVAECRICSMGDGPEGCKPCDNCSPVILSVHPCADAIRGTDKASVGSQSDCRDSSER